MTRHAVLVRIGSLFEITGVPYVANVGDVYSYTFGTQGGTAPITWTCTPNPLGSSGVSFSAGVLSGTVTHGGVFPFTLVAVDSNRQVATANFNLIILGTSQGLLTESGAQMYGEAGQALFTE